MAAIWYNERENGLARRFRDEQLVCIRKINESPSRFPVYLHGTRRLLMDIFPYSVIYLDETDEIVIIAIAHAKRRPGYWRKRT